VFEFKGADGVFEYCTAARLLEAMNQTVDPCDDFFEFACGTWNRHNVIPSDRSYFNTFRKLGDELQATLKGIVQTCVVCGE
jgi:predicted metalloendopeptidase